MASKVLFVYALFSLGIGITLGAVGIGMWMYVNPPLWWWIAEGVLWGGAMTAAGLGAVVDE